MVVLMFMCLVFCGLPARFFVRPLCFQGSYSTEVFLVLWVGWTVTRSSPAEGCCLMAEGFVSG